MLNQLFADPIHLRLAQAFVAILLTLLVAYSARRWAIRLERETIIALARGIIQIVSVGFVLTFVITLQGWGQWLLSLLILVAMMIAASMIAARRTQHIPGIWQVALAAIVCGPGLMIALLAVIGVIDTDAATLIPVGSIVIANAMNTMSLALERFAAEVESHAGQIEAGLALGAAPNVVLAPYVQTTIQAALIPSVNNLRSLGIVWIPGVMAGMILAGSNPLEAALYQFVIIAMLFATAGITALSCTLLARAHFFSAAEQLRVPSKAS